VAGFNIVGQIQLTGPTNLGAVVRQIQSQLSGITAQVNLNLSGATVASITNANSSLQQFNNTVQQLTLSTGNAITALGGLTNAMSRVQGGTAAIVTSNRGATQSHKQLTQAIQEGISATEEFGKTAGLALRRFSGFSVAAGGVFGLIAAFKSGVTEALLFEREMIKLIQVGAGTQSQIEGLGKEIGRLSSTFGVSSKDLSQASVLLASAGYSANQVTEALQALAKAALSPQFGNMIDTTNGLIAIMAQFKVGTGEAERALGSINAVSNAYATESKDLIEAVKRTGGAFRASGGDFNQFLALFTSVRATTRESADAIATGLRTVFTRFQRPETVEQLRELGVNLRYTREEAIAMGNTGLERQFIGPYEAVRRLNAALRDVPTTDPRYAAIVESLGGYRQVSRVIPLIQEFNLAQRAYVTAQSGANSVTTAAEQAQQAFLVRLTAVKEQFFELFRVLVGSSAFKTMLDGILTVTGALIKLGDVLSPLLPLITTLFTIKIATALPAFLAGFFGGASGASPKRVASGGSIPGVGNSDTVPALLTPGEFVIRKSAASTLGPKTLDHINRTGSLPTQRFAAGGEVLNVDKLIPTQKKFVSMLVYDNAGGSTNAVVLDRNVVINPDASTSKTLLGGHSGSVLRGQKSPVSFLPSIVEDISNEIRKDVSYQRASTIIDKKSFIDRYLTQTKTNKIEFLNTAFSKDRLVDGLYSQVLSSLDAGLKPNFDLSSYLGAASGKSYGDFVTSSIVEPVGTKVSPKQIREATRIGAVSVTVHETSPSDVTLKTSRTEIDNSIINTVSKSVVGIASKLTGSKFKNEAVSKDILDKTLQINTIAGRIFEAANQVAANTTTVSSAYKVFDFSPDETTKLAPYYQQGNIGGTFADAKYSRTDSARRSIVDKAVRQFGIIGTDGVMPFTNFEQLKGSGSGIRYSLDEEGFVAKDKFATGGVVPGIGNSDTVPALLTPGEFVIRKGSAQQIGYEALSRLNKGGVATFAEGGDVSNFNLTPQIVSSVLKEFNTSTGINFGKIIKSIKVTKDLASEVLNQRGYPLASSSVNPRGILLTPNENEVDPEDLVLYYLPVVLKI
jgi:TP901 family phage tail tape measure protein